MYSQGNMTWLPEAVCHHSLQWGHLHCSYPSPQEKSVVSGMEDTCLKMSLNKSTGEKTDFTIKLEYNQLIHSVFVTLMTFQEKVCSLANEYLDMTLAYSAQVSQDKNKLTQICEMVRFLSHSTDVQLITVGRLSKSFPYYSDSKETG